MQSMKYLGRYRFKEVIGPHGGDESDKVYRAENRLGHEVAIRVLKIAGDPDSDQVKEKIAHFEEELEAIAHLRHPSVVPLIDYGWVNENGTKSLLLVIPLFHQEESLPHWVHTQGKNGRLPSGQVKIIVQQAVQALHYVHDQGIVHGNVRLSQFFVSSREGESLKLQLSGLGVARFKDAFSRASLYPAGTANPSAPAPQSANPDPIPDQRDLARMAYGLLKGGPAPVKEPGSYAQSQPLRPRDVRLRLRWHLASVLQRALNTDSSSHDPKEGPYPTIGDFGTAFSQAGGKIRSVGMGFLFWFLMTLVAAFLAGCVLAALNWLPTIVEKIGGSLVSALAIGGILSVIAGSAVAYLNRRWKELKKPFIIAAVCSVLIVTILAGIDLKTSLFTDPYTHQGVLAYTDPLANDGEGFAWDQGSSATYGGCLFNDGTYDAREPSSKWVMRCVANARNFNDFVYEVQMTITEGTCGGIIFRDSLSTPSEFYFFKICKNGSYTFGPYIEGKPEKEISSAANSPYIHTGLEQPNMIAAAVQGNAFSLYVNGEALDTHIIDTSLNDGHIGVFAEPDSEVLFSDLHLWTL